MMKKKIDREMCIENILFCFFIFQKKLIKNKPETNLKPKKKIKHKGGRESAKVAANFNRFSRNKQTKKISFLRKDFHLFLGKCVCLWSSTIS